MQAQGQGVPSGWQAAVGRWHLPPGAVAGRPTPAPGPDPRWSLPGLQEPPRPRHSGSGVRPKVLSSRVERTSLTNPTPWGTLPSSNRMRVETGGSRGRREGAGRDGRSWGAHSSRRPGLRSCRYTCSSLSAAVREPASSSTQSWSRRVRTSRSSACRGQRGARARPHHPPAGHQVPPGDTCCVPTLPETG